MYSYAQYVAPTWLNGYAIHNVSTELIRTNESGILNTTYLLTIIPATCQTSYLPLLNITLEGDRAGKARSSSVLVVFLCFFFKTMEPHTK